MEANGFLSNMSESSELFSNNNSIKSDNLLANISIQPLSS